MKLTKEGNELVLRLPLRQNSYDAAQELIGQTENLIGVVAGNNFSISQLMDLGYKGDQQEGMPYIVFVDEKSLREACTQFGLDVWVHEICGTCKKVIRGAFTYNDKGNCCFDCEPPKTLEE